MKFSDFLKEQEIDLAESAKIPEIDDTVNESNDVDIESYVRNILTKKKGAKVSVMDPDVFESTFDYVNSVAASRYYVADDEMVPRFLADHFKKFNNLKDAFADIRLILDPANQKFTDYFIVTDSSGDKIKYITPKIDDGMILMFHEMIQYLKKKKATDILDTIRGAINTLK